MKRWITLVTAVILVFMMLTACGGNEPEADSAVESMIMVMVKADFDQAMELLHPDGLEKDSLFVDDWGTMCTYLNGHELKNLRWQEYTTYGTVQEGSDFEETGILEAIMKDGTVFDVTYTYIVNGNGSGFSDFHLNYSK